jgi:hypothetical protein
MNGGAEQRDVEIRATIDELNEAAESLRRLREEEEGWNQENPSPKQPQSVKSMTEVERFEQKKEAWNELDVERRARLEQAHERLKAAQKKLVSLLPEQIGYEYKGKRYQREGSSYRTDRTG